MKSKVSRSEAKRIKAQQSGRRLSAKQQQELTRMQTRHPKVEEAAEAMKAADRLPPGKAR